MNFASARSAPRNRPVSIILAALALIAVVSAGHVRKSQASDSDRPEPFFFVVMADPQLGWAARDANTEIEELNFRKAIEAANRLKPAFVIICGDLVNKPGDSEQIETFKRLMSNFSGEYPVYLVSGNHDVTGAPTPETIEAYRQTFGPERYTFDHGSSRFIVINSTILVNGRGTPGEPDHQLRWVEAELERARNDGVKDIFVAQHHPWFWESADEPYRFLNNVPPDVRKPYLDLFEQYGVMAAFAGHLHRNQLGRDGDFEMITTGSITPPSGDEAAGLRVVKVYGDTIEHEYFALDEVPAAVTVGARPD